MVDKRLNTTIMVRAPRGAGLLGVFPWERSAC